MLLNNALADGGAETSALPACFRRKVGLKEPLDDVVSHTASVVFHVDLQFIAIVLASKHDSTRNRVHGIDCIRYKVVYGSQQLGTTAMHRTIVVIDLVLYLHIQRCPVASNRNDTETSG